MYTDQIKIGADESSDTLKEKLEKKYRTGIKDLKIIKESVDARDKTNIMLVYTVAFSCSKKLKLSTFKEISYNPPERGNKHLEERPVIIGMGPCGMSAALILAQEGYRPVVLERGKDVDSRIKDVEKLWNDDVLDEESNVQFGEGGAGTFSDGKLNTGIKDPRIRKVFEEFVKAGAPDNILYKAKPHIGTDILRNVVKNIRKEIISLGGEIRFQSCVTDIVIKDGKVTAVEINGSEYIDTSVVIAALGHSARDTFAMFKERGINMTQKPFSIGVRVVHLQEMINESQYGSFRNMLPPAEYKLSHRCENGRGVYTFCMCPGGEVVASTSCRGMTVTNGMSYSARDGKYANSALLVDVKTSDFDDDDVLAGVRFQEKYEKLAYELNNNSYMPLKSTWKSFRDDDSDRLSRSLPDFVKKAYIEAMPYLGKKLKGFDGEDTIMLGVETRSSSPVRILRNEKMESETEGLYPAGEGAGYAGGITSAAVDGIKAAEMIIKKYTPVYITDDFDI